MRHQVRGRQLSVDTEHRKAMRRNLVMSLFLHGAITTTVARAKEVRGMAEKLITLARRGRAAGAAGTTSDLAEAEHYRRRAAAILGWHRTPLKTRLARKRFGDEPLTEHDGLLKKLFGEIAERFADRPGGYTRILHIAGRRLGDGGRQARLELVPKEAETIRTKPAKVKRSRHRRAEGLETLRKKREQRKADAAAKRSVREQAKAEAAAKEAAAKEAAAKEAAAKEAAAKAQAAASESAVPTTPPETKPEGGESKP
jgi:large subunit ribosomal protein L17